MPVAARTIYVAMGTRLEFCSFENANARGAHPKQVPGLAWLAMTLPCSITSISR